MSREALIIEAKVKRSVLPVYFSSFPNRSEQTESQAP